MFKKLLNPLFQGAKKPAPNLQDRVRAKEIDILARTLYGDPAATRSDLSTPG